MTKDDFEKIIEDYIEMLKTLPYGSRRKYIWLKNLRKTKRKQSKFKK